MQLQKRKGFKHTRCSPQAFFPISILSAFLSV